MLMMLRFMRRRSAVVVRCPMARTAHDDHRPRRRLNGMALRRVALDLPPAFAYSCVPFEQTEVHR
jgi:hypothetical protein